MTEWRSVDGIPGYEISDDGRVRSYWAGGCRPYIADEPQRIHGTYIDPWGYEQIKLRRDGEQINAHVHRLVAHAFLGRQRAGFDVHHINGNRSDNRLCNLEYISHAENCRRSYNAKKPLGRATILDIRNRRASGQSVLSISAHYGLSHSCISSICRGKSYPEAGGPLTFGHHTGPRKEPL